MCLAVPGKVISMLGDDPVDKTARVSFGGVIREVYLACVPDTQVGDYVLVHAGLAISTVDPEEAAKIFAYLEEADQAEASDRLIP